MPDVDAPLAAQGVEPAADRIDRINLAHLGRARDGHHHQHRAAQPLRLGDARREGVGTKAAFAVQRHRPEGLLAQSEDVGRLYP